MTLIETLILAIVEGITEFLPISSTGHLILTSHLLGIAQTDFLKTFEIIIQLGAILAVVLLYARTLLKNKEVWLRIFIAFLPTGFLGFTLYKYIKTYLLSSELITVAALFIGGILLIIIELMHKEKEEAFSGVEKIPLQKAFLIGLFQSLAMIPGVSRAAATIIGGLLLGTKRQTAVEFSFLLAIPTMAASSLFDLFESNLSFSQNEITMLGVGFVGSFIVALLAVKFFLKYITNHTFIPFGIYRIILAILYWTFMIR